MTAPAPADILHLWWLADPETPRHIGSLRLVRRTGTQPAGVSVEYARTWIGRGRALSEDLPLQPGEFMPAEADAAAGAVDDARPDRWGERVIRLVDRPARLSTLEFLYYAGDDRFGALGVSTSEAEYLPRRHGSLPSLSDVQQVYDLVRQVEAGEQVPERLRRLITPGASLGGARPKALLTLDGLEWVLKFGGSGDPVESSLVEHATMTLAGQAGIEVCETRPIRIAGGYAIAVQRFDRAGGLRVHALSAHVALRAAGQAYGYPELALLLRRRADADAIASQGAQLFRRMVFNILIDNTDDHEKNHALLVNERQQYALAPAYDVLPSGLALGYQQMRVGIHGAESTLENALSECRSFSLTRDQATQICQEVGSAVGTWRNHFSAAGVSDKDVRLLAEQIDRPFLADQRKLFQPAQKAKRQPPG